MRGCVFRWLCGWAGLLLLGIAVSAQTALEQSLPQAASIEELHLGFPQDWSSRHLLMPGIRVDDLLAAGAHDPRYVYNYVMRQVATENQNIGVRGLRPPRTIPKKHLKVDWAVSLENGYVPQNQFPAKYQFDVVQENCNSDFVVFGLTTTGAPKTPQGNIVGINNLYTNATPACNGGSPWVAFAYNTVAQTNGQIKTSPVLSEDGTKVAFVESTAGGSYFHVLVLPSPIPTPPAQSGTVLSPNTPTACPGGKPTTPECMTTLTIQTAATDSNSSPWVDYNTDMAYVGADNGVLYKITPVFGGGAPALVSDPTNWPVTVSTNTRNTILTNPVVDDNAGLIFLGDGEGYLYSVSLTAPAKTTAATQTIGWAYDGSGDGSGAAGTGIVDPPIVVNDPANTTIDQVFAFTGCSYVLGTGGAVSQVPANFATGVPTTANTVDLGSASGDGDCTGKNVHSGTFDNAFWLYGSTSGHLMACGFVNSGGVPAEPQMYFFDFSSGVITSTGSTTYLVDTTKGDECSPLTEFYNGTTDRMFFGAGSTGDGYLMSSIITPGGTPPLSTPGTCTTGSPTSSCVTSTSALGGTSGIIIDNQLSNGGTNIYFSTLAVGDVNGQKCASGLAGGSTNPYCAVRLTQSGLQ
jgi:hypothetical protein